MAYLLLSVLAGVLLAGLALPLATAAGTAVRAESSFFEGLPSTLQESPLPQTSVMLAANGVPLASFYDENRVAVPLAQMSPFVQQAVVAVEDSRFYQHGGVDTRGMARAVVNDETGGNTQGASTLTQQYVKNMVLEQATAAGDQAAARAAVERTPARKLRELRLAVAVEHRLTKQQILERYLNIVYVGRTTYGLQAGALRYFGVPASHLTLPQAATLAGMIQSPATYDPFLHPAAALARRNVVLTDMLEQGMIDRSGYERAVATPVRAEGTQRPSGCQAAGSNAYFCDYVISSILHGSEWTSLGRTVQERARAIAQGGLVIKTTLDRATQEAAETAVRAGVPPTDGSGLAAAAVTVEPGTGRVIAMAQDRTYGVDSGPGTTSVNFSADQADGGSRGFQTGSSFKPFTLAAWLTQGHRLQDQVDATPRSFAVGAFSACGHALRSGADYAPGNSEGTESGRMSVLDATAKSVNVAYVDMESQLDLCDIASTAQSLGVHLAAPERECALTGPASTDLPTCLPSLTLGVKNVAPLTMAAAYAGFATGGTYCSPMAVTSVTRAGSTPATSVSVASFNPRCRRALRPDVASTVNVALEHVLAGGTAASTGPLDPWPSAGKTGTTDGPYDTWFVGYTAQRSTAVWVGDPGNGASSARRRLADITVNGEFYPIVYGASIAAPIWKQLMTPAQQHLPAVALP